MSLPETTMIYAVYWPESNVFKVGRAWKMSRLRGFTATGGHILLLMRDCPLWEENAALSELRTVFARAFRAEHEALLVLPRGRGFTECFSVAASQLGAAFDAIFRGIAKHGHEQGKSVADGSVRGRKVPGVAVGGAVDGRGVEVEGGRPRAGIGEFGSGESGCVETVVGDFGGGDRRSSVDVGRSGLHRIVSGRRPSLVCDGGVAGGISSGAFEAAAAAEGCVPEILQRVSRVPLGCGGRGGVGERERVGGPGRGSWLEFLWRRRSPVFVLQDSPSPTYSGELSALRYCPQLRKGMGTRSSYSSDRGPRQYPVTLFPARMPVGVSYLSLAIKLFVGRGTAARPSVSRRKEHYEHPRADPSNAG